MSGWLAVEERRKKVFKLLSEGVARGKVAEILGVHRNTITSDCKYLRRKCGDTPLAGMLGLKESDAPAGAPSLVKKRYALQGFAAAMIEVSKMQKAVQALDMADVATFLVDWDYIQEWAQNILDIRQEANQCG